MPKVKVFLNKNETIEEADLALEKALNFHSSGDAHEEESFDDPAMVDTSQRMDNIHDKIYSEMMKEVSNALDEDFQE